MTSKLQQLRDEHTKKQEAANAAAAALQQAENEERFARKLEEEAKKETVKAALEKEYGVVGNPKADSLWLKAWDFGHHAQDWPSEVRYYYRELVGLIKP